MVVFRCPDGELKGIDRHFSEVLTEIKEMASELRPMAIDAFGLVHALEQLLSRPVK